MQKEKPPETTPHPGRATSPQSWAAIKSCYGQNLIGECSIIDRPSRLEDLQLAPGATPPQTDPRPPMSHPLLTRKPKRKAKETEIAPQSPWESQGQHTGPPHMPHTLTTFPHKLTPTLAGKPKHPQNHQP